MGHSHSHHSHAHEHCVPKRSVRILSAISIAGAVAVIAGMFFLWPASGALSKAEDVIGFDDQFPARVASVDLDSCPGQEGAEEAIVDSCVIVVAQLLAGPDNGEQTTIVLPDSPTTPNFDIGERIAVGYSEGGDEGFRYAFLDRDRSSPLWILTAMFAAAVVLLGRLRGLAALGGLAVSVVVIIAFIVPALLAGGPPVLVAAVGAAAIAYVALYLAHGFTAMTTVALLGALGSLGLTVILASVFTSLTKLSGFASDETILINLGLGSIDASGLVLAGIVIGVLGALDDVTITQASAAFEIHLANPSLRPSELYSSAIRIGRDHVSSIVNTLLLAYAGASMPLLLYFALSRQGLGEIVNQEIVATEIVRTLVGSIGLVASVPLTTFLAAHVAAGARSSVVRRTEETTPKLPRSS